jgi:hypothetical protein
LTPLLGTGSLLLFDEFVGADMAEARAFQEWRDESGVELLRIADFDRDPSGWARRWTGERSFKSSAQSNCRRSARTFATKSRAGLD